MHVIFIDRFVRPGNDVPVRIRQAVVAVRVRQPVVRDTIVQVPEAEDRETPPQIH